MVKIKPIIDKRQMINNPLTQTNFRVMVNRRISQSSYTEDEKGNKHPHEIEMEAERYVKLYNNSDARKSVGLISAKARSLLMWIMFELDAGQDWLWINKERYKKEYMVKDDRTYEQAILELVRYLFIQPSVYLDTYWINPRLFFAGSRINKYWDKIIYTDEKPTEYADAAQKEDDTLKRQLVKRERRYRLNRSLNKNNNENGEEEKGI